MDTKTVSEADRSKAATEDRISRISVIISEKLNLFHKLLEEVQINKKVSVTAYNTTFVSKVGKAKDGSITEVDGEKINLSDKLRGEVESNKMETDIVCKTICVSRAEKTEASEDESEEMNHFNKVPDEIIENIFSFITYHEVSKCREVCRRFNKVAKGVLNRGYFKARLHFLRSMQEIKNQLPRRESERRKHKLCKKNDILCSIEPRINLLGMTYLKFIEGNYICFIPGKVLDELFKVIHHVMKEPFIAHGSPLTRELRDLILMAIEDFDEKIFPYLKYKYDPTHTQPNHFFWDGTNRSRDPLLKKSPEGWIKPMEDSFEHLESKVTASENKLDQLVNKVSANEIKLEQLTEKVTASESKIEQLESLASKIRENERKIEALGNLANRVEAGESKIKQLESLSDKVSASENKLVYLEELIKNLRNEDNVSVQKIKGLKRKVSLSEKEENPTDMKVVQENYNGFTVILDPQLMGDHCNTRNDCPDLKRIKNNCPDASDNGNDNKNSGDVYDVFEEKLYERKINWKLPTKSDRDDGGNTADDNYNSDDYYNMFKQQINKHEIISNSQPPIKKYSYSNGGTIDEDYDSGDYYNMFKERSYKRKINWNWEP
ncbi:F-box only protein 28, partial [Stegodyphus mimosarum]